MALAEMMEDELLAELMRIDATNDDLGDITAYLDVSDVLLDGSCPEYRVEATRKPRKRPKHELEQLRALATQLEAQLTQLTTATHQTMETDTSGWQQRVAQLAIEKQRALCENLRLRNAIETQRKLQQTLQKALDKSADVLQQDASLVAASASSITSSVAHPPRSVPSFPPRTTYAKLFQSLDASYHQRSSIFQSVPCSFAAERRMKMEVRSQEPDNVHAMCIQVVESRGLNFQNLAMADATWAFLSTPTASTVNASSQGLQWDFDSKRDNDLFGECSIKFTTAAKVSYTMVGNVAVRRYREDSNVYFLWEAVGDCLADDRSDTLRIREQGWVMFQPSRDDPAHATIFRSCVFFTPLPSTHSIMSAWGTAARDIGSAMELILAVHEQTLGYLQLAVVGALEAQATTRAGQGPSSTHFRTAGSSSTVASS